MNEKKKMEKKTVEAIKNKFILSRYAKSSDSVSEKRNTQAITVGHYTYGRQKQKDIQMQWKQEGDTIYLQKMKMKLKIIKII